MEASAMAPFWGAPTSYLNFCEEDYGVTRFVAEFVNTLSSLAFVAYGAYGLCQSRQKAHAGARLMSYAGLIGVGVCSAGYHMTLKYHTQMSDELSMHLLTTPLLYRLLTFRTSPRHARLVGLLLSAIFTIVMLAHMIMDEFLLHATFGLAVLLIVVRVRRLIPEHVADPLMRNKFRDITTFGLSNFVLGYVVWLLDGWACRFLTEARHSVGLPLAFLLELHGWWHVLTAVGGYVAVAVVDVITSVEVHKDAVDNLAWPVPLAVKLLSARRDMRHGRAHDSSQSLKG